jgi:glycosyl transferase family 25
VAKITNNTARKSFTFRTMNELAGFSIPVFVLHVKRGYEARELHMKAFLARHGLQARWILDRDKPELDEAFLKHWFKGEMQGVSAASSCAAKHLLAWQALLEADAPCALVLEDDIVAVHNFRAALIGLIDEAKERELLLNKAMVLSLENSGLKFVPKQQRVAGIRIYEHTETRCAGAYLISRKAAEHFVHQAETEGIHLPVDWWMNTLFPEPVKVYWSFPTLAEQGSHNGLFDSSIDQKKGGWFRRISWQLQRWFKERFRSR